MPQEISNLADVIEIVFAVLAAFAYWRREALGDWLKRKLGYPAEPTEGEFRSLTRHEIENEIGVKFSPVCTPPLEKQIIKELATTKCITRVPSEIKLKYTLDWGRFFRDASVDMWKPIAARVANDILNYVNSRVTHVIVLPHPRSDRRVSWEAFTRMLVQPLKAGDKQVVVQVLPEGYAEKSALWPVLEGSEESEVVIFEPFEFPDERMLPAAVNYLTNVHGCDIKAVVTFFKVTPSRRRFGERREIPCIDMVQMDLT